MTIHLPYLTIKKSQLQDIVRALNNLCDEAFDYISSLLTPSVRDGFAPKRLRLFSSATKCKVYNFNSADLKPYASSSEIYNIHPLYI